MVEIYVNDIENALKNKSYFSALAMSLALPDICGAAEYPNETSTAKRYIEWYNKYLGEYMSDDSGNPYLSGEIVYNLRNTFLHAGSPNIDSNKIKDEANQLDGFGLILGDGTEMCMTLFIKFSIVKLRAMIVDVTYLCKIICDRSLWYYKNNTNKFHFDFSIDTQDHFYSGEGKLPSGDPIIEALNQKLEQSGDTRRFQESQDHTTVDVITGDFNYIFSNEELKQKFLNGEKIKLVRTMHTPVITSNTESTVKKESAPKKKTASPSKKKTKPDKREAQVRSFFGQHFKEKKYKQKKEIIIQAILKSKTKQQVNNALMKSFASEETGVIYKRLSPLLASLPGI
ncbi:hypothetical protein DW115_06475 [Clostridium sp. AM09-51]|uniref:hypothetical protein n=1 Tax=Pseudoruminococcus massiliensis TaxID=2086583 RepID=UPI000E49345E|nr:hypothetical protein [Pseudoruminococcus massiliensis]RHO48561.1 hypothetical protein DW115_06475 [Clostridium sp. AM09-51]